MLTKMIDGQVFECTTQEERVIRMFWDLNDKFPEYHGHLMFDGINEPRHDMVKCKEEHQRIISAEIQKKLDTLSKEIEVKQENGISVNDLFSRRKSLKSHISSDLSLMNKVEDLKSHLDNIRSL